MWVPLGLRQTRKVLICLARAGKSAGFAVKRPCKSWQEPKKSSVVNDPREYFALANRHVVEADERIAVQQHRIDQLRQAGRDTGASEDLLRILLETRKLMLAHKELLEREIAEWRTLHPEH